MFNKQNQVGAPTVESLVAAVEEPLTKDVPMETSPVILMFDIESLDVGPRSVVTQIGMYGFDLDDEEILPDPVMSYLPIQPQLNLINPRSVSASTIIWWMGQSSNARAGFEQSSGDDFEELASLMRHLVRNFNRLTNNGTLAYELWARGPQFDIVNIESLLIDVGLPVPWKYNRVRDLRTLMAQANLKTADVPEPKGYVQHHAGWDCRYQLDCYMAARKALRSHK